MTYGSTISIPQSTIYAPVLNRSFTKDAAKNKEMAQRVGKELMKWPSSMRPTMAALPLFLLEGLLASDFKEGLLQTLQEALIQLLPKGGINGLLIRHSWPMFADEAFVEIPEYLAIYILPTIFATLFAHPVAHALKLPHYELLGRRMYDLEKDLGKTFEIGTVNPKTITLDKELLNKLAFGKLMTFLTAASVCGGGELMVPGLRVFISNKVFNTNNFYEISGLEVDDDSHNAGAEALEQAKRNIRNAMLFLGIAIPSLLGLTFALAGGASKYGESKGLLKASKMFDLSGKFGLSKVLAAVGLIVATYSYLSVARNPAEFKEIFDRIILFSIPCVLFYKQTVGNILAWSTGIFSGLGNILSPLQTYWKEAFGDGAGKRDILDIGLVDLKDSESKNDKQLEFNTGTGEFTEKTIKVQGFTGKVTELEKVKQLKLEDPEKYRNLMKRVKFMKDKAPYWLAFGVGILINWLNYLRTSKMHEEEMKGTNKNEDDDDEVLPPALKNSLKIRVS